MVIFFTNSADGKRGNYGGSLGAWIDDGTGRFTAPQDGLYQLGSHGIAHGSNNDGRFAVYVNGTKKSIPLHKLKVETMQDLEEFLLVLDLVLVTM